MGYSSLQYSCLENPTQRSLAGSSPRGRKRVGHDLVTEQQQQLAEVESALS